MCEFRCLGFDFLHLFLHHGMGVFLFLVRFGLMLLLFFLLLFLLWDYLWFFVRIALVLEFHVVHIVLFLNLEFFGFLLELGRHMDHFFL